MNQCCHVCRSSLMTCLESGNCPCHWWQAAKDTKGVPPTYADPTASTAMRNMSKRKQQRRNRRQK